MRRHQRSTRWKARTLRKLTGTTMRWLQSSASRRRRSVAKSHDGNEVHGLLTMPVGYTAGSKVPMLLRIHGGPTAQDAHGFSAATGNCLPRMAMRY